MSGSLVNHVIHFSEDSEETKVLHQKYSQYDHWKLFYFQPRNLKIRQKLGPSIFKDFLQYMLTASSTSVELNRYRIYSLRFIFYMIYPFIVLDVRTLMYFWLEPWELLMNQPGLVSLSLQIISQRFRNGNHKIWAKSSQRCPWRLLIYWRWVC